MMEQITRFAGKNLFRLKEASPTLFTVLGVAGLIGAGVLAAKASMDVKPVIEDHEADLAAIDLDNLQDGLPIEEAVQQNRMLEVYARTGQRLLKMYGPSIALAALSTAGIFYGHKILKGRNAALVAAYGVLERGYNAYRDRVRTSIGENAEKEIYEGNLVAAKSGGKDGVTYEPVKPTEPTGRSPYAMDFGPDNIHWNRGLPEYNLVFLRAQERYANDRLRSKGVLLLNDVLDSLGMPRTKAGLVVGWVWNGKGDNYVDFGLYEAGSPEENDYFYFYDGEGPIFLDFNVDGVVSDQFKDVN